MGSLVATDSLTGTLYKEIKLYLTDDGVNIPQNYNLLADGGVIDGPSTGYYFYVDNEVSSSTLTFVGNNDDIDTLTFNCPVIFSTRERNSTSGGNNKEITILGKVVFNKGVRFDTHGRVTTSSGNRSKFYLGDTDPNTASLVMTCRYTDAVSVQNMPFDAEGYGEVHYRDGSRIHVHAQKMATAAIDQFITSTRYNIFQSADNNHRVELYFGDDMVGKSPVSMRQVVVYPDVAPIRYNLHITANIDTEIASIPEGTQIYVTAEDARVSANFTDTALIDVVDGAKISLYGSVFQGASPLINLTGDGVIAFEVPDPDDGGDTISGNEFILLDTSLSTIFDVSGSPTIIPVRGSNVILPEEYYFTEPHSHFEGFTFDLTHNESTYDFGNFTLAPLFLHAYEAAFTTIVTVDADYGVNLNVDSSYGVQFQECDMTASEENDHYALYKSGGGTFSFIEGTAPDVGFNRLFIGHNGYFITDIDLNGSSTYQDIGEVYCKFYLMADQMPEPTHYTFSSDNYNLNALHWLTSRGAYFGTNEGEYVITSNYLVSRTDSTLSAGSTSRGLVLKNDVAGAYACTTVYLSGHVGTLDGDVGRLHIDTADTCTLHVSDFTFYDNNTVVSPLLMTNDVLVTFNNVVFNMVATNPTYICNSHISQVSDRTHTSINIIAIKGDKSYDLDIAINDTTTEPPFVFNTDFWYITPVKFDDSSETYKLINVNSGDNSNPYLTISMADDLILDLHSLNPVIFNNLANTTLTFDTESEITNFNYSVTAPIILHTNDLSMSVQTGGATIRVYGFGSVYKTGSGEVSFSSDYYESADIIDDAGFEVGDEHQLDMSGDTYTQELDPADYQDEWFNDMAPFTDENILAGDKTEGNRLIASYWDDLGGDILDDWGYFYLYDVSLGKYYFPIISPVNRPNGEFNTQVFEVFGRSFTIKHGWCVQGIFKMDITSSTSDPFRFGAYGNMGSDEETIYEHLDYSGNNINLYYHHNWEDGDNNEHLYTYIIPKVHSENTSRTYRVGYEDNLQPNETGYDDMNIVSNAVTHGLIVYFAKGNDVREWVDNDITGGSRADLHYYANDYDYDVSGILETLEYTNNIQIHEGTFNFVHVDSRLTFDSDTSDNIYIGEEEGGTVFTKGVTFNHSEEGSVTFRHVNYDVTDNDSYLLLTGTGNVYSENTSIVATSDVSNDAIRVNGTTFTISSGEYIHNGSSNYIAVGDDGRLVIENVTLINIYGSLIYSESDMSGNCIALAGVTLDNSTDTPIIRHVGDGSISLVDCIFDQEVPRVGAVIEHGRSTASVEGNIVIDGGSVDMSASYTYFMRTYTNGFINTSNLIMDATNTNILWPTLRSSYDRFVNEVNADFDDPTEPYTCIEYDEINGTYGYIAYSYDPTEVATFYHNNNGIYYDMSADAINYYDLYVAFGHLGADSTTKPDGAPDGTGTITYTSTMGCTRFVDMLGATITTGLETIFTTEVFAAGYVGKIDDGVTETFAVDRLGSRVITLNLDFVDSTNIYIGDTSISVTYGTPTAAGVLLTERVIEGFNYVIDELSSPPSVSIDAGNVAVSDTIDVVFSVPIELYKTNDDNSTTSWGYALPIYIVPVSNDIIQFFVFKNAQGDYVSYDVYSGYPETVNRDKLQRLACGVSSGTFDIKYVGSGVYYEPPDGSDPANASIDTELYGDGNRDTLLYSTVGNGTGVNIVNVTTSLTYPMAYIGEFGIDTSSNDSVVLYGTDTNDGNRDAKLATLVRPTDDFEDFLIRYTFTMNIRMPLITYDDSAHMMQITGVDVHDTGNVSYTFSDPSGCTIDSASGNVVTLTFDGDDTSEKTIEVTVDISGLDSTHGGTVYFKRPNYPIQFVLASLKPFKGYNSSNEIIEVESTTQTASSYFNFPNLIIVSTEDGSYLSSSDPPEIDVQKGETRTISIMTAGIISTDTPEISDDGLQIEVAVASSKGSIIMPTTTDPNNNIITITENNYSGSIDITFSNNGMISGAGSYYTVTFDQDLYETVASITYIDTGMRGYDGSGNGIPFYHTITHTLGIQPDTRLMVTADHSSDDGSQAPSVFNMTTTSVDSSGDPYEIIVPTSYLIAMPVTAYTNFLPYNTTTGETASFKVNYRLVGIVGAEDPTSLSFDEGTHYEIFDTDLSTAAPNYVLINGDNYDAEDSDNMPATRYFFIKTQAYDYVDFYVYYTDIAGTDMANAAAVDGGTAVKVCRYDFSAAPPNNLDVLNLSLGTWLFSINPNGELVIEYNGTEGTENGIGAQYIFPKTGGVIVVND